MIRLFRLCQKDNSVVAAAPSLRPAAARSGPLVRVLLAGLKPCPSGPCHGGVVAWCGWEFDGFIVTDRYDEDMEYRDRQHRLSLYVSSYARPKMPRMEQGTEFSGLPAWAGSSAARC